MTDVDWLGLAAGSCTTAAFVPQVLKTWRSKSAHDLSLGMFLIFAIGVALWIGYGVVTRDLPVIVANVVTFGLASALLYFKLRWRDPPRG